MTSNRNNKKSQPFVTYELADNDDEAMSRAFDILFEETMRDNPDLTTNDD